MTEIARKSASRTTERHVNSVQVMLKGVVYARKGDSLWFFPYTPGQWKKLGEEFCKKYRQQKCTIERIWVIETGPLMILELDVKFEDGTVKERVDTDCFSAGKVLLTGDRY